MSWCWDTIFFFYVLIGAHAVSWHSVIIYNYDVSIELSVRKINLKAMLKASVTTMKLFLKTTVQPNKCNIS
jgi:hypothetical protein